MKKIFTFLTSKEKNNIIKTCESRLNDFFEHEFNLLSLIHQELSDAGFDYQLSGGISFNYFNLDVGRDIKDIDLILRSTDEERFTDLFVKKEMFKSLKESTEFSSFEDGLMLETKDGGTKTKVDLMFSKTDGEFVKKHQFISKVFNFKDIDFNISHPYFSVKAKIDYIEYIIKQLKTGQLYLGEFARLYKHISDVEVYNTKYTFNKSYLKYINDQIEKKK